MRRSGDHGLSESGEIAIMPVSPHPLNPQAMADPPPITRLLLDWREGEQNALERLVPMVYSELHRIAHRHLGGERRGHTLATTDLVHETFLSLFAGQPVSLHDRAHLFAVASRVMRRVLVWHARRRNAAKRGGGEVHATLPDDIPIPDAELDLILSVEDELARLELVDPRLCRVVECRFFAGLDVEETAEALGISTATVKRDWRTARNWLQSRLAPDGE